MSKLETKMKEVLPELVKLDPFLVTTNHFAGQLINTTMNFGENQMSVTVDFVPGTEKVRGFDVGIFEADSLDWVTAEWFAKISIECGDTNQWTSAEDVIKIAKVLQKHEYDSLPF